MIDSHEQRAALRLKEVDDAWNGARVGLALSGLERRIKRRRITRASLGVAGAVSAAVLALLFIRQRPPPIAPTVTIAEAPAEMTLGDGSIIRPDKGASVVVREVAADRVRVDLELGSAGFEIARRPERTFVVEAGAVRVIVVGTRFSMERLGERSQVRVTEGHVRVEWGEDERDLHAGEEGIFPDARVVAAVPAPGERVHVHDARTRSSGGEWRRLARDGGYREAYDLIVAGPESVHDDVDDLLLAADAARHSGHALRALPYLERVEEKHARDDRAPLAAFTRGRIFLELDRPGEGAEAFDRAILLGATGSLHENALARAVEAYSRSGNRARAATLARSYLSRYPDGRWLAAVKAHAGLGEPALP